MKRMRVEKRKDIKKGDFKKVVQWNKVWGFHWRYNIQFWKLLSTCKSETPSLAYLDVMRRVV